MPADPPKSDHPAVPSGRQRRVDADEFSNNAFNHHHGIQSTERFGKGTDPDGDGFIDEMTRADVTAVSLFQATMAVPGRVIPMIRRLKRRCCSASSVSRPPAAWRATSRLSRWASRGGSFSEPNPFDPASPPNLLIGQAPSLSVDLTSDELPLPRLRPVNGVVMVQAYTDLKLEDNIDGPCQE